MRALTSILSRAPKGEGRWRIWAQTGMHLSTGGDSKKSNHGNTSKVDFKLKEHDILFQNNHLLIVNKRAGVPTQPDVSKSKDLTHFVKEYIKRTFRKKNEVYLGLCNRLDRAASGAVVFAKTSKSAARVSKFFHDGDVEKEYLAVVEGDLDEPGVITAGQTNYIDFWKARGGFNDWKERQFGDRRLSKPDGELKYASCGSVVSYTKEESKLYTLLAVRINTGRKHQIRRQLAMLGHPIVGDKLYGSKHSVTQHGPFEFDPILLHASKVEFKNPVIADQSDISKSKHKSMIFTGDTISATCQPPRFWRQALRDIIIPELKPGESYFEFALKRYKDIKENPQTEESMEEDFDISELAQRNKINSAEVGEMEALQFPPEPR